MGVLENLLDGESRLLRKAERSTGKGIAYSERRAKYRAHRSISKAYRILQRGRPRIHRHGLEFAAVYANIARGFYGLHHYDSAWGAARDALTLDARNPTALEVQGLIQLERGAPSDALVSFDKALRSAPVDPSLWGYRGDAALVAGRKDEAITSFRKVADLAMDDVDNYGKLLRLTPHDAEMWVRKAEAHVRRKEAEDALHAFERALRIDGNRVDAWTGKAFVHESIKQFDRALRCLDKALALEPHSADLWFQRGRVLTGAGSLEEALRAYDSSLECTPENVRAWTARGELLITLGRPEEAVHSFDTGLRFDRDNVDVLDGKRRA
ncbi:MAG TPA: tetratricopeptide repeat protein, partial [Thermoplasmata archaeon]|nr:tetratricopeptide repeat protein [Thermoplasmata archaeon]